LGDSVLSQDVIVTHDYLNQRGGAERVVLEMASIWPQAPLFTSLFRPDSTFPEFGSLDVRTSFLDRLPVDRRFRTLFPLYPAAFGSLGPLDADIVVSSSSGWAHGVRTVAKAFHAVYCHTPARWLYGSDHIASARQARVLEPFMGVFRRWDRAAARRADLYIANSEQVRGRIKREYGLDSVVVHPPVDVDRFRPSPRGERLLVVSRLLPYKRVDLVVDAAKQSGIGLDVVGTGPALDDLRRRGGPSVRFHGRLPDRDVTALMQSCLAFCLPGREDFGITAVEANAAGKPVVALAAGGALETLEDSVTASFFHTQRPDDVLDAIRRCEDIDDDPAGIARHARRFSNAAFAERLTQVLAAGIEQRSVTRMSPSDHSPR
jgi:glycosyltransferase involved in cell wall biosynthesis